MKQQTELNQNSLLLYSEKEEKQEEDKVKIRCSTCNKQRYQAIKDDILKYDQDRYACMFKKEYMFGILITNKYMFYR